VHIREILQLVQTVIRTTSNLECTSLLSYLRSFVLLFRRYFAYVTAPINSPMWTVKLVRRCGGATKRLWLLHFSLKKTAPTTKRLAGFLQQNI
jgi:hypothetical protein